MKEKWDIFSGLFEAQVPVLALSVKRIAYI